VKFDPFQTFFMSSIRIISSHLMPANMAKIRNGLQIVGQAAKSALLCATVRIVGGFLSATGLSTLSQGFDAMYPFLRAYENNVCSRLNHVCLDHALLNSPKKHSMSWLSMPLILGKRRAKRER
jgi:hypothetical protein